MQKESAVSAWLFLVKPILIKRSASQDILLINVLLNYDKPNLVFDYRFINQCSVFKKYMY